jgi:hypothetical protein
MKKAPNVSVELAVCRVHRPDFVEQRRCVILDRNAGSNPPPRVILRPVRKHSLSTLPFRRVREEASAIVDVEDEVEEVIFSEEHPMPNQKIIASAGVKQFYSAVAGCRRTSLGALQRSA